MNIAKNKITVVIMAFLIITATVLLICQNQKEYTFDDMVPSPMEQAENIWIQYESIPISEVKLNKEQTDKLLRIFNQLRYKKDGKGNSLQDCYARVNFENIEKGYRVELMLSNTHILVNNVKSNSISKIYTYTDENDSLVKYLLEEIN